MVKLRIWDRIKMFFAADEINSMIRILRSDAVRMEIKLDAPITLNPEIVKVIDEQIKRSYDAVGARGVSLSLEKVVTKQTQVWQTNIELEKAIYNMMNAYDDHRIKALNLELAIKADELRQLARYVPDPKTLGLANDFQEELTAILNKYGRKF